MVEVADTQPLDKPQNATIVDHPVQERPHRNTSLGWSSMVWNTAKLAVRRSTSCSIARTQTALVIRRNQLRGVSRSRYYPIDHVPALAVNQRDW